MLEQKVIASKARLPGWETKVRYFISCTPCFLKSTTDILNHLAVHALCCSERGRRTSLKFTTIITIIWRICSGLWFFVRTLSKLNLAFVIWIPEIFWGMEAPHQYGRFQKSVFRGRTETHESLIWLLCSKSGTWNPKEDRERLWLAQGGYLSQTDSTQLFKLLQELCQSAVWHFKVIWRNRAACHQNE